MSTEKRPKKNIFIVGAKKMSLDPLMVESMVSKALAEEEAEMKAKSEAESKLRRYAHCPLYEPNPQALGDLALINPTARINGAVLMEFEETSTGKKIYLHKNIVNFFFRRIKT